MMLLRLVVASLRYRARLYLPMLVAVALSAGLVGTGMSVGESFAGIVEEKMQMYGANVILTPEEGEPLPPGGVGVELRPERLRGTGVTLAITNLEALLEMNPAWMVRGEGEILVGAKLAERLGISQGEEVEVGKLRGRAAILESGTEFDSYLLVNGTPGEVSMLLLRVEEPGRYRGRGIVLEEMLRAKYAFLEGIRTLILYVSVLTAAAALAGTASLARMDAGERRREFGVLRALGASRGRLARVVLAEYAAVGALSCALALGVWAVLSSLVLRLSTGAAPVLSAATGGTVLVLCFLAFFGVSGIYLLEATRKEAVEELRGE